MYPYMNIEFFLIYNNYRSLRYGHYNFHIAVNTLNDTCLLRRQNAAVVIMVYPVH